MTDILVLYEDSRSAKGAFGPHEFFLGCVADDKGANVHALAPRARDCPMRGVSKLIAALRDLDGFSNLIPAGRPILAVIDEDRVRDHVPDSAWTPDQIEEHLKSTSSAPSRLTVVLLERNVESIIEAIGQCGEHAKDLIEAALRKNLNERDTLLTRVGHDPGRRQIRDCVRKAMASVDRIVDCLKAALT